MEVNKLLVFQISIHAISIAFLYIYFFGGSKVYARKDTTTTSSCKPKVANPVDAKCFKQQCDKAATETECDKYARCTWSAGGTSGATGRCMAKVIQCDELRPLNKPVDRFKCGNATHCKLDGDTCEWHQELLQSGPKPKIINETSGLNKYCSKRKGKFNIDNINEFAEDEYFVECMQDKSSARATCEQNAKIKLECNSLEGHTFDKTNALCKGLKFEATKVKERPIVPPHEHKSEVLKATATLPREGFMSDLFVIKDETVLRYYMNAFVLAVVVLTNIGFAKWISSRR